MRRAIKIPFCFATATKLKAVANLLEAYRGTVNRYIESLWITPGGLDKETLAWISDDHTRLTARYKAQALRQALSIVTSTRKSQAAKKRRIKHRDTQTQKSPRVPIFQGPAVLDAKFVTIEPGRGSFDLVIRLSTLNRGQRITIPCKKTAMLNKWMAFPGATLIQGGALSNDGITIWVEIPDAIKPVGKTLAVDIGCNKLLMTSDGEAFGTGFKQLRDVIRRKVPGSKGCARVRITRDNYINRVVKQIPWDTIRVLGVEDLKDVKFGKSRKRGKSFRRAMAPWTYRRVLEQIGEKAEENRVLLLRVPPAYTSRTCPICHLESESNRVGENFHCVGCGYTSDADYVGAVNVLARTTLLLSSLESDRLKKLPGGAYDWLSGG